MRPREDVGVPRTVKAVGGGQDPPGVCHRGLVTIIYYGSHGPLTRVNGILWRGNSKICNLLSGK